jgi:hypothetical protein
VRRVVVVEVEVEEGESSDPLSDIQAVETSSEE